VSVPRQVARVAVREAAVEAGTRETAVTVLPYVGVLVLAAGLGFGPVRAVLAAVGPGVVWLVVLVAAVPLAGGVAAAERAEDAWDVLRALASPAGILLGKTVGLWVRLGACWAVASLLAVGLLGAPLSPAAAAAGVLGLGGVAVATAVLGLVLPDGTRRPGLLAVLLLPATLPVLLAGTQAATAGVPAGPWLALLAVYDLVMFAAGWALAPALLEE
jgi:heme exporter protein B